MNNMFPQTAISAAITIVVIFMGLITLQTMSILSSVQSSAAQPNNQQQQTPPFNQGQCQQYYEERGFTKEQALDKCKELMLNQGECIQYARDNPQSEITEEECREFVAAPPTAIYCVGRDPSSLWAGPGPEIN